MSPHRTTRPESRIPGAPCFPAGSSDRPTRPFGVIVGNRGPVVGRQPTGSALPAIWLPSLRGTMASADFPGHFLPGISPDKSALLPRTTAAFTSVTEPTGFAVLCQLATPRRPSMRFLSVGPPVSPSLPPHGRLPFRSWLQVVVSHVAMSGSPTGDLHPSCNEPMLGVHNLLQPTPRTPRLRSAVDHGARTRLDQRPGPSPPRSPWRCAPR